MLTYRHARVVLAREQGRLAFRERRAPPEQALGVPKARARARASACLGPIMPTPTPTLGPVGAVPGVAAGQGQGGRWSRLVECYTVTVDLLSVMDSNYPTNSGLGHPRPAPPPPRPVGPGSSATTNYTVNNLTQSVNSMSVTSNPTTIVRRGYIALKEEGLRAWIWSKRWAILREQSIAFYKSEVSD